MRPAISVVVPMLDAEGSIGQMIASLLDQAFDEPWEIVVVDNGSSDRSVAVVEDLLSRAAHPTLVRHHVEVMPSPQGYASPRNRGVERSHAPLVAFCDADGAVGEGWLAALTAALGEQPLVASRKLMVADVAGRESSAVLSEVSELPTLGCLTVASAAGLGCTRELFDALDGLDPHFDTGGEDTDFAVRAGRSGVEPVLAADAVYWSSRPQQISRLFRRGRRVGRSQVRLLVRHHDLQAEPPTGPTMSVWRLTRIGYRLVRPRTGRRRRDIAYDAGFAAGRAVESVRSRVRCF